MAKSHSCAQFIVINWGVDGQLALRTFNDIAGRSVVAPPQICASDKRNAEQPVDLDQIRSEPKVPVPSERRVATIRAMQMPLIAFSSGHTREVPPNTQRVTHVACTCLVGRCLVRRCVRESQVLWRGFRRLRMSGRGRRVLRCGDPSMWRRYRGCWRL